MDRRKTLEKNETFLEMLTVCMKEKQKVAMLLDDHGLDRAEGWIKAIHPRETPACLELESGQKIEIGSVVAVNGVFSDSYSEC